MFLSRWSICKLFSNFKTLPTPPSSPLIQYRNSLIFSFLQRMTCVDNKQTTSVGAAFGVAFCLSWCLCSCTATQKMASSREWAVSTTSKEHYVGAAFCLSWCLCSCAATQTLPCRTWMDYKIIHQVFIITPFSRFLVSSGLFRCLNHTAPYRSKQRSVSPSCEHVERTVSTTALSLPSTGFFSFTSRAVILIWR